LILSWKGAPFVKEVLPSNRIYLPSLLAPAETVVVRSGALCASTSTYSSPSALQTAPYAASFTITARDEYANLLDGLADAVPLAVRDTSLISTFLACQKLHGGQVDFNPE